MGLEKAIFCRICGQKYFPVSLPFHLKVCIKLFKLTHTDCPICKRAVNNIDWRDHVDLCKKIPNKLQQNARGMSVIHTIQSLEKGSYGGLIGDAQGRHPCMVCGRKFTGDRISTHENVCRRRLANGTIKLATQEESSHSVDPNIKKQKMMTLSDLGRPKSKQASNKMPSLKNKPAPVKKQKEVQAFAGKGVKLGSFIDEKQEEKKKEEKTFSGLKKVNGGKEVKVEFRWRCLNCLTINKVQDNQQCLKCGKGRELTKEEEKKNEEEEQEMEKMLSEWGKMEDLEEKREDLLDLISELEIEATPIFICYALEKLIMIFKNIIQHPEEDKYKTVKMDNQVFYSNIGRFGNGTKLLKFIGFNCIRVENNKLAYKYEQQIIKGNVNPFFQIAYDELRTALAKNKGLYMEEESNQIMSNVQEFSSNEQERIECQFCCRRFANDRIDTHQRICYKLMNKPKRKKWDEKTRRIKGTVFEKFQTLNPKFEKFQLCLSRRDISNMQKIFQRSKLSREEYATRMEEFQTDYNIYYRCRSCKEIMLDILVKTHKCEEIEENTLQKQQQNDEESQNQIKKQEQNLQQIREEIDDDQEEFQIKT